MDKSLPARPSLEQLKKLAKDLSKAHEEKQPAALALIREHLPAAAGKTDEEIARGESQLRAMGIPRGAAYVCLTARDSAFLDSLPGNWSYHNYRDCDIQNYALAAEALADRGYIVLRMGAKVREPLKSSHPRVIDYATNGMRSDFMDIYLGANCAFCISCGTGFDAVPLIFRRPIAYVNMVPLGYLFTFRDSFLGITKHHLTDAGELSLREIFSRGLGFALSTSEYEALGVKLAENTPEEIRDLVIEMADRLSGQWKAEDDDDALQRTFWNIFPTNAKDPHTQRPLHGDIRGRFGSQFLRNNRQWLK